MEEGFRQLWRRGYMQFGICTMEELDWMVENSVLSEYRTRIALRTVGSVGKGFRLDFAVLALIWIFSTAANKSHVSVHVQGCSSVQKVHATPRRITVLLPNLGVGRINVTAAD